MCTLQHTEGDAGATGPRLPRSVARQGGCVASPRMSSSDEWAPSGGSAESSDDAVHDEVVSSDVSEEEAPARAARRSRARAAVGRVSRLKHRRQAVSSDTEEDNDGDIFAALRDSDSESDVEVVAVSSQKDRDEAAREVAIDLSQDEPPAPLAAGVAAQSETRRVGTKRLSLKQSESNVESHSRDGTKGPSRKQSSNSSNHDDDLDLDLSDEDEQPARLSRQCKSRPSVAAASVPQRRRKSNTNRSAAASRRNRRKGQGASAGRGDEKDSSDYSAEEEDDDDDADLDIESSHSQRANSRNGKVKSMSPRAPACQCARYEFDVDQRKYLMPDTREVAVDEITSEDLFKTHICWQSPDGTSQMCFNLSTLKKIALTKQQWMAPPHFRSPMDATLKRQIIERFGRDELNLPTRASMNLNVFDLDNFMLSYHAWLHRRLNDLSDLYVCPVCYTWVQRQNCDCNYDSGLPEVSEDDPMLIIQRSNAVITCACIFGCSLLG